MTSKSDVIVVKKDGKVLSIGIGELCFELDAGKVVDCYANSFPPEVCKVTNLPIDTTQKRKDAVDLCQWAWDNDMYEIEEH